MLKSRGFRAEWPMNLELLLQRDIKEASLPLTNLKDLIHDLNSKWWHDTETGKRLQNVNVGEKLMLIVSEVAEAMEGDRKGLMDDHLPHRRMLEVELADALIRILDLSGGIGLDITGAVEDKLIYNMKRKDHMHEERLAEGGKRY